MTSLAQSRKLLLIAVALIASAVAGVAAGAADGSSAGRFSLRGSVVRVVDGDTVQVALSTGRVERVRLIGIDTPELGRCFATQATAATRGLALGKRVVLTGDPTQATRDRYSRLLAYVGLPGGKDLGYELLARGTAKVYVYDRPFQRLARYRIGEGRGKRLPQSVWKCGAPKPKPGGGSCDPSYPDVCIKPYDQVGDLDCGDVPYRNFRVLAPDPHGFDGGGDGVGCEG